MMVFDENAGRAIACGGESKEIIETNLERARPEFLVEIGLLFSQSQMPLPDRAGRITGRLKQPRKSQAIEWNTERGVSLQNAARRPVPPGILAG